MLRRILLPLLALVIVACSQQPGKSEASHLQDSTAEGARYTLLHAWAPW